MNLWLRVGDDGEYENFGDDLDSLLEYLNELAVGNVTGWVDAAPGFDTPEYHDDDLISLYWGDDNADFVRHLSDYERAKVEEVMCV